jgi:hypothetical protein
MKFHKEKYMRHPTQRLFISLGLASLVGTASAHGLDGAGLPVCLESNFMVADSGTGAGAGGTSIVGPGRVLEVNLLTGQPGVAFGKPAEIIGPWRPTGVLSGGINGHTFINGAAQHTVTEFHRDGTPIRTVRPMTAPPADAPFGSMPRLLGSQFMPNGNIALSVCDAEFPAPWNDFTRPASTPERARNSRILVLDPVTLQAIDEYSAPYDQRWTCMAGIIFAEDGMYVSMFHGGAVFVIDWRTGVDEKENDDDDDHDQAFTLGQRENRAKVVRVIDMLGPDAASTDPRRRDSLRAISFDSDGNLYAANRRRDATTDTEPRHRVEVVPWGSPYPERTLALDPGVQVVAGIRTNRISARACTKVRETDADNACDYETVYVASTATGNVLEYSIDPDEADATDGTCSGNPAGDNSGCAQPLATFLGAENGQDAIDPRMLMIIHGAFVQ